MLVTFLRLSLSFHLQNLQVYVNVVRWGYSGQSSWLLRCDIYACRFLKKYIYLFLERGEEKEKERERNIWCERGPLIGCLSHSTNRGSGPQPRHMPDWESNWQPFSDWLHPTHWATPVRAMTAILTYRLIRGEFLSYSFTYCLLSLCEETFIEDLLYARQHCRPWEYSSEKQKYLPHGFMFQ